MSEDDPILSALREARDGARIAAEAAKPLALVPKAVDSLTQRLASLETAVQRAVANTGELRTAAGEIQQASREAKQAAMAAAGAGEALAGTGWKLRALLVLLCVLVGVCLGALFGVRLFPASLMATPPGCAFAGGNFYPPNPAKNSAGGCAFPAN
jgi:hypothetical protein